MATGMIKISIKQRVHSVREQNIICVTVNNFDVGNLVQLADFRYLEIHIFNNTSVIILPDKESN